jgi:hypothetical protein
MDEAELVLDGNALAGILQEVFAAELTSVRGTCGACEAVAALATVVVHVNAPGVVVRCRSCGEVLLVCVRHGDRLRLGVDRLAALEFTV